MLIHLLLPRSRITKKSLVHKANEKIKRRVYSIKDSQDSFMSVIATETEYKKMYDSKLLAESSIAPFISLIGSLEEPQSFTVNFENITYKFSNFSKAMDVCFKVYNLFDIAYPEACGANWDFINRQLYGLHDGKNAKPGIDSLLNEIKCESSFS